MKYKEILRTIAKKEGITSKQVEKEMQRALKCAGIKCTAKHFIKTTAINLKDRLYIV